MNNERKKYSINGWRGTRHSLTAKKLYERVLEDSKSDYNWIASATELVRICKEPDFPKKYANGIKIAILNCFANLEIRKEYGSYREPTDNQAVYYCYHSLPNSDENAVEAKEKYLKAIIDAVTRYTHFECRFPVLCGPAYQKVCSDWKDYKFRQYITEKELDFEKVKKELYDDFEKTIKKAEDKGVFKEDDEKQREEIRKLWQSLDLKNL